jgi:hypothetical protein
MASTRRSFLGSMVTAVGALPLVACVAEAEHHPGLVEPEVLAAPAGGRYANVLPLRVPDVRR